MKEMKGWLLCWKEPCDCLSKTDEERKRFTLCKSADEIADKLIEIVGKYNKGLKRELFGVMDFENEWLVIDPGGFNISLEDVPCYCSDEWVAKNSSPVI